MYRCKYNFWNDNKAFVGFQDALSNTYDRSYIECINDSKSKNYVSVLAEIMPLIEDYYASIIKMGYVDKRNFNDVLKRLKSIDKIIMFNNNLGLRGVTINNTVSINPIKKSLNDVNREDMFKLTVFHELGHIICNSWTEDENNLCDKLFNDPIINNHLKKYGINSKSDLCGGLILLEDVLVEEAAEDALYRNEKRPSFTFRECDALPGVQYKSNYSLYGVFHELAMKYLRCFEFLDVKDETTISAVVKKGTINGFSSDFIKRQENEIMVDYNKCKDFALMLGCLGKIKNAYYSDFGMGTMSDTRSNLMYYNMFNSLAKKRQFTDKKMFDKIFGN